MRLKPIQTIERFQLPVVTLIYLHLTFFSRHIQKTRVYKSPTQDLLIIIDEHGHRIAQEAQSTLQYLMPIECSV